MEDLDGDEQLNITAEAAEAPVVVVMVVASYETHHHQRLVSTRTWNCHAKEQHRLAELGRGTNVIVTHRKMADTRACTPVFSLY